MTRMPSLVIGLVVVAATASAQSNIRNARLESRPGADLAGTFQALSNVAGPIWIGYGVPAQDPDYDGCCYDMGRDGVRRGGCTLDENRTSGPTVIAGGAARAPIQLEAAHQSVVLYRVENREVERIRTYSESCELDAGGATVYWLSAVDTAASVDLLLRFAARPVPDGERRDRLGDGAMLAITTHRDPAADRALATLMAPDKPIGTRKQAAFWAGNGRGRTGFEMVRKALLDTSTAEPLRKHLVFAVSQSREAEAVDTLTGVARSDDNPAVRGEALFWLAQKAGRQATSAITEAIERDPDTKVKERAVFALSQLPRNEGVPKLIDVARTNRNPAVRKQAMFWLGQSRDSRALDFFVEVLARP
ncbi:MAG: HEAT repeat domain-containing protein [Vicinamibacteraceae bacterium]